MSHPSQSSASTSTLLGEWIHQGRSNQVKVNPTSHYITEGPADKLYEALKLLHSHKLPLKIRNGKLFAELLLVEGINPQEFTCIIRFDDQERPRFLTTVSDLLSNEKSLAESLGRKLAQEKDETGRRKTQGELTATQCRLNIIQAAIQLASAH